MVQNGASPISSKLPARWPKNGRNRGIFLTVLGVLKMCDADGQPYVLVGGHAVNYWAEHYLSADPQLEKLRPFTSEDIDFTGGHADVQRIARQLELNPSFPPKVATTAMSGFIPFQIGDLKSAIEVVRRIKVSFQSAGMSRPASSGQHFWG